MLQPIAPADEKAFFIRGHAPGLQIRDREIGLAIFRRHVPHAQALRLRGQAPAAVGGKIERGERAFLLWTLQRRVAVAPVHAPGAERLGQLPEAEPLAVRREGVRHAVLRGDDELARLRAPQPRGAVARAGEEQLAVRAEAHADDRLAVAAQQPVRAALRVPEINLAILTGHGELRAIRRPRDQKNAREMFVAAQHRAARMLHQIQPLLLRHRHLRQVARAKTKHPRARADAARHALAPLQIEHCDLLVALRISEHQLLRVGRIGHARDDHVRRVRPGHKQSFARREFPHHQRAALVTRAQIFSIGTETRARNRQARARTDVGRFEAEQPRAILQAGQRHHALAVRVGEAFELRVHQRHVAAARQRNERTVRHEVRERERGHGLAAEFERGADGGGVADDGQRLRATARSGGEAQGAGLREVRIPKPFDAIGLGALGALLAARGPDRHQCRRQREREHDDEHDAHRRVGAENFPTYPLARRRCVQGFF